MKPIKIAINGFGRIGRAFFKIALERPEIEVVAVNDLIEPETLACLLRYDTVYGRYEKEVLAKEGCLAMEGRKIQCFSENEPERLPWKELDIDVVVESTGVFDSYDGAQKHIKAGAKRVVISAPAKGDVDHVLIGANEERFKKLKNLITSDASCTTNAAVPVAAIMYDNPGILKGTLTTVHAYTATQKLIDGPDEKDLRRGRAAAQNIVPSTTGAAEAVVRSLNYLEGIFDGLAIRVPVICGSLLDFTFLAKRKTSADEINEIFKKASQNSVWKGILRVTQEPVVSSDIIKDPHASIVDLSLTKVIDSDLVKVFAWYDNEWGYSNTLVEHVIRVGKLLS